MTCENPIRITKNLSIKDYPDGLIVPCGRCCGCRIQKSKEWSIRMLHEASYWTSCCFVTLTYNNENVPDNYSLKKRHLQLYFKRLRKELSKTNRKMKYYACGEYGDKYHRPHYHAIFFGISWREKELLQKCWDSGRIAGETMGYIKVGTVTFESSRYVAQYFDKQTTLAYLQEKYTNTGREVPFKLSSTGLGKQYVIDNAKNLSYNLKITFRSILQCIPRYYIKILKRLDSTVEEKLQVKRSEHERELQTYWTDRLILKYALKKNTLLHPYELELCAQEARRQNVLNVTRKYYMMRSRHKIF